MSGPSVQHCNLEADPAQIFGQVFAAFGCAVQADDQLIAVDAVGARKLEKGCEAVLVSVMHPRMLLPDDGWARLALTQASNPVP